MSGGGAANGDVAVSQVLSVASNFGSGSIPFSGHTEGYQLGLARAARAAGIGWSILAADPTSVEDPSVIPLFDRSACTAVAERLDGLLDRSDVRSSGHGALGVVVYEGDTELVEALAPVAARHRSVRFLINLFRAEPGIDVPLVRHRRAPRRRELEAFAAEVVAKRVEQLGALTLPSNVVLTAETAAKALFARSAGLPVSGVWHLHSELSGATQGSIGPRPPGPSSAVRVLVSLRSSQLHRPVVEETIDVIESVRRAGGPERIVWVMNGRFDAVPRVADALKRLRRSGVEVTVHERPLPNDRYAEVFRDVDVVWMPAVWPYRVQSSGKALDALVMGRPLIAPAGTAGASAMQRWVPGMTGYGTAVEAAQLFLRLPAVLPLLRSALEAQRTTIERTYSAATTVEWALTMLAAEPTEVRDGLLTSRSLDDREQVGVAAAHLRVGLGPRLVRRAGRASRTVLRTVGALPHALRAAGKQILWRR